MYGGGGEIRTLGGLLTHAGFQDRCIQPLCHPSEEAANHTGFPLENKCFATIFGFESGQKTGYDLPELLNSTVV